jgi:ATP-dependent Clp protease ATP-binding subunit ClpA
MRMDKLTSKFQMALADAQSLAVGQDHQFIEPAHVMVALLDQQGGSVRGLLTSTSIFCARSWACSSTASRKLKARAAKFTSARSFRSFLT